ncbi:MAG: hypothetical protein JO257_35730 [Deltaproteobacteria bacterium]|nr:hypothetical protein [Deltaproteobacteria bacterium]
MRLSLLLLVACACPAKKPVQQGGGSAVPSVSTATTCDGVKPRVEQLYRAEAEAKEPKRVDEAVADNTQMVMNDCAKDPAKTVPCLAKAATVSELEKDCLIPLDDEGTEAK